MTIAQVPWFATDKDKPNEVASRVFDYVQEVERTQQYLFERFYRLACLYDPYFAQLSGFSGEGSSATGPDRKVQENVVASNVDTVCAVIAAAKVRPRVLLDDASWEEQRTARRLSFYAEGLGKLLDVHPIAVTGFRDGALKGTGLAKVSVNWAEETIRVERVMVDDIVVDEGECRTGTPKQMHQRVFVDRDQLKSEYPEKAAEIDAAQRGGRGAGEWGQWASYRPIERNQVVVIESWRLPYGKLGSKHYRPGRHTICVDQACLFDEPWEKRHFPFAVFRWTERACGWYGVGGAERIAGHQRRINKSHWQIDRQNDQLANPTTYVHLPDANIAVKTTNRLGTIAVYKSQIPTTVIPKAVSPDTYARLDRVREGAYEEFGVSRLAATARKPGGLDSGAALREYRDQTTQRFAQQEERFERFVLDIIWLALDAARDLALNDGTEAPVIVRHLAKGRKKIHWRDVDLGELKIQLTAASTLSRTPAGRTQTVQEWAQAGIISLDEARSLLRPFDPLDLDRTLSLYAAALDDIDRSIDAVLDGDHVVPEPYQNIKLGVWRFQQAYLQARGDDAPEETLEALRDWIVQGAHILAMQVADQDVLPANDQQVTPETQLAVNMIPHAEAM